MFFPKPYEFEGMTYEEIELDLESFKDSDISAVKRLFTASGLRSSAPIFDSDFCAMVAARASKQPLKFFNQMPAHDYLVITATVTDFFN